MYLAKEVSINLIKNLGFDIVSEDILASNIPIPALAFRKDKFFFVEYLYGQDLGFIEDHFKWIDSNIDLLKSKFRLKNITSVNLLSISFTEKELSLEIPNFRGELDMYKTSNGKDINLVPFKNWVFNKEYFKNRLSCILSRVPKEEARIINSLFDLKPLFIKEELKDYFSVQSNEQCYRLKIFKNFIWFHEGFAPFRPRKILIKS